MPTKPEARALVLRRASAAERRRDDAYIRARFWPKFRRVLRRLPFAEDLAAAYYCLRDPATPARVRAVLAAALVYFIVPSDLVPDFIAGLGFGDDATVLYAALSLIGRHVTDAHREEARARLAKEE